jgi:hypothetical protein
MSYQAQIKTLKAQLAKLKATQITSEDAHDYSAYRYKPVEFLRNVLKFVCTPQQEELCTSLIKPPYRTLAISANKTGKSSCAARIALWWFCTRKPAKVITTAPTDLSVKTIMWAEMRQAAREHLPHMKLLQQTYERAPNDYMIGLTALAPDRFQGKHGPNQLYIFDESCHDDQTDVMTEHGWRRFADLDGTERLLTMDPETHISELVLPDRIVKKHYVGDMYEYDTKGSNWCVTPGHNMFWRRSKYVNGATRYGPWIKSSMEDVASRVQCHMTRTVHWQVPDRETFVIPAIRSARRNLPDLIVPMDDWAIFLGWFCSEGHIIKAKNGLAYGIGITQHPGEELEEIQAVCERLGFRPKRYSSGPHGGYSVQVHSLQIARWLAKLGDNSLVRRVPDCIREASARQIGLFLDAYLKGDGYRKRGTDIFYTSSSEMADDLQELILKTGMDSHLGKRPLAGRVSDMGTHLATSTTDGFVVSRCYAQGVKFKSKNLRLVPYNGFVWCAALPYHHLLLTRRNGNVIWSGNTGIPSSIFGAVETMFKGEGHAWLCLFNPLNTNCQVYLEEMRCKRAKLDRIPPWHRIRISALDHPNVLAALEGKPSPFPSAVEIEQVERTIKTQSQLVGGVPDLTKDIQWPPEWAVEYLKKTGQKPRWYRPNGMCEITVLGRWPTSTMSSVWSDGDWMMASREGMEPLPIPRNYLPHFGIDVARYGDDNTAIHVRCGPCSLHHEEHNGWGQAATELRLKDIKEGLLIHYRNWFNLENRDKEFPPITEFEIPIKIDDDGVGGGLVDSLRAEGYNVIAVNAASRALRPSNYVNRRSELWMDLAERSRFDFDAETGFGGVDFSRLNPEDYPGWLDEARRQATTPSYKFDQRTGQRYIDPKEKMKEDLKRSPDTMDAVNLAYSDDWGGSGEPEAIDMRGDPMRQMGPQQSNPLEFGR